MFSSSDSSSTKRSKLPTIRKKDSIDLTIDKIELKNTNPGVHSVKSPEFIKYLSRGKPLEISPKVVSEIHCIDDETECDDGDIEEDIVKIIHKYRPSVSKPSAPILPVVKEKVSKPDVRKIVKEVVSETDITKPKPSGLELPPDSDVLDILLSDSTYVGPINPFAFKRIHITLDIYVSIPKYLPLTEKQFQEAAGFLGSFPHCKRPDLFSYIITPNVDGTCSVIILDLQSKATFEIPNV